MIKLLYCFNWEKKIKNNNYNNELECFNQTATKLRITSSQIVLKEISSQETHKKSSCGERQEKEINRSSSLLSHDKVL